MFSADKNEFVEHETNVNLHVNILFVHASAKR